MRKGYSSPARDSMLQFDCGQPSIMSLICDGHIVKSKESVPVAYFKHLVMMPRYICILFLISHSLSYYFSIPVSLKFYFPYPDYLNFNL